jgi:hypothetical protein
MRTHSAVLALLQDPAWGQCSNRAIARYWGIDPKMVAKWRRALSGDIPQITCTVQRNGTTYPRHLPASPRRQAQPQFLRTAPTIAQALVIQRPTPVAAQRLLSRLQALALNYGAVVCVMKCHPSADAALVAAWEGKT